MKGKIVKVFNLVIKNIKKYFSNNILFTTFVVISLFIGLLIRLLTVGGAFAFKPLLSDLMVVLIIGSFSYLLKPKNRFIYLFFWIILFTVLAVANTIYYEFYKSFISVNLIATMKMLREVDDSLTAKLNILQFLYIIGPIIFFVVNHILIKKEYSLKIIHNKRKKKMFFKTALVGVTILVIILSTLSRMEVSRFVKQWNREFIVERFGLYVYTCNDVIQSIQPKINSLFGYDEAARVFREFYTNKLTTEEKEPNKYTDIFKGKNVLFIHAESMQNFLVNMKINNQEITPTLNKLSKEGIYFSKFYPQISVGTSSDTEFTLLTGLMPSSSGTVFVSYFDRTYEGMPKYFNNLNYYTFSMHANEGDYWNRKVMHKNLGYQKFYARGTYEEPEGEWIGLGLSDKSFLSQVVPIIKNIRETKSPFMGTIITLTNHSPFKDAKKYVDLDLTMPYSYLDENGKTISGVANYLENTEMGDYIKSVHYADQALGEFINNLDVNGLLDNTVIVIYGDHDAKISKRQFELMYNYDPVTNSLIDKEDPAYISLENYGYDLLKNTPFIIWTKDKKFKKEVKDVMGMYDVLPTIANMFGFETNYNLGHDIFSKNEKVVIFPNGNFLTNKVYYNNFKDDYITLTDEPIESDYIEKFKEYTNTRLEVSNNIIVYDLIAKESHNLVMEAK